MILSARQQPFSNLKSYIRLEIVLLANLLVFLCCQSDLDLVIIQPLQNLYSRYIADDLEAFERAIFTSDWKTAVELTDKLVGFGMGLTPSCDDFLTAFLVVFWCAGELRPGHYPWVSQFNQAVARTAKKQTTLISANMLGHAMNGKICRSHQQLVRACLFNHNEDLILLASQVMRHGASSGADFMLGLVYALDWYCQSIMDFPMEGEQAWVESLPSQAIQSQPVPII